MNFLNISHKTLNNYRLTTAVLRSPCSMRFSSEIFQDFVWNHFWKHLFCFEVKPPEMQLSDTLNDVVPENSLLIIRFHDTVHTVKASEARSSKATLKRLWTSTMFYCRDSVFLSLKASFFLLETVPCCHLPKSSQVLNTFSQEDWDFAVWLFHVLVSGNMTSGILERKIPFHSDDDG